MIILLNLISLNNNIAQFDDRAGKNLILDEALLVGEELGERRWRKLNIELTDLTDCDDE